MSQELTTEAPGETMKLAAELPSPCTHPSSNLKDLEKLLSTSKSRSSCP